MLQNVLAEQEMGTGKGDRSEIGLIKLDSRRAEPGAISRYKSRHYIEPAIAHRLPIDQLREFPISAAGIYHGADVGRPDQVLDETPVQFGGGALSRSLT
jgi:hypothetical protein